MPTPKQVRVTVSNSAFNITEGQILPQTGKIRFRNGESETPVTLDGKPAFLPSIFLAPVMPEAIEAYGYKGFKGWPWRKTFKSAEALNSWVEKNDATVQGTRTAE